MDSITLTTIGIRLLALYYLLKAIAALGYVPFYAWLDEDYSSMKYTLPGVVVFLVFAAALYASSHKLATFIKPISSEPEKTGINPDSLQVILFAVAGLFVVALAIPKAASLISTAFFLPEDMVSPYESSRSVSAWVAVSLQFVLGCGLFFGAQGLQGLWRWARTRGLSDDS
jgi:hypothetical protein